MLSFKDYIKESNTYEYQLLGRLKSDCKYFLGHGNHNVARLWAGSVEGQIEKMKELYNNLEEKPDWLSMEDILDYEKKMLAASE